MYLLHIKFLLEFSTVWVIVFLDMTLNVAIGIQNLSYVKLKNSQIYTMNHDLQSIKQKVNNDEKKITIYASKDFHINKHEQPIECKVIATIDDILKLREHEEYNLIQRDNNLVRIFCDLINAGYEPYVSYYAGQIVKLILQLS